MKKLLFISVAIVIAATSCQKDTNGVSSANNSNNAIKGPGKHVISNFSASWHDVGTFSADNYNTINEQTLYPSNTPPTTFWNWTNIDFRNYGYLQYVNWVEGKLAHCEMAYYNNTVGGNDANGYPIKGGAEMAYYDIIPQAFWAKDSSNYNIDGKHVSVSGIYDIPDSVPTDGNANFYANGAVNNGGWLIQTNAHFVPPGGSGGDYAPLVHVESKYYGVGIGYYQQGKQIGGYGSGQGYYNKYIYKNIISGDQRGHSFKISVDINFNTGSNGVINYAIYEAPLGTRDFTNATAYTGSITGSILCDPAGSDYPKWGNVNCSTGCYEGSNSKLSGAVGVNSVTLKGYY